MFGRFLPTFSFFLTESGGPAALGCSCICEWQCPGYIGPTELPEKISKLLFLSVPMRVPDFQIICKIMLMAEGFKTADLLTMKATTPAVRILSAMFLGYMEHFNFSGQVKGLAQKILDTAVGIQGEIAKTFIPTAVR